MTAYFISYSRRDLDAALWFAQGLREAGAPVWFDQVDIQPSDRWDRSIEAALRACAGLVLILSPNSAASENVLDEVTVALDAGKPVIPLMIETCSPPLRLARVQWIDARTDRGHALARCRAALGAAPADAVAAAPRFQPAPAQVDALARLLAEHLGPMARHVVMEEARGAASLGDLVGRLKRRVPDAAAAPIFARIERDLGLGLL